MNKNFIAVLISPLVLVPLSLLGTFLISGFNPISLPELFELILFTSAISLPVGYVALIFIVLPTKWLLVKINRLSVFNLTTIGSIYGGILFVALDYTSMPGHDTFELTTIMVFFMGAILGASVTLSYVLMSGITNRLSSPVKHTGRTRDKSSRAT